MSNNTSHQITLKNMKCLWQLYTKLIEIEYFSSWGRCDDKMMFQTCRTEKLTMAKTILNWIQFHFVIHRTEAYIQFTVVRFSNDLRAKRNTWHYPFVLRENLWFQARMKMDGQYRKKARTKLSDLLTNLSHSLVTCSLNVTIPKCSTQETNKKKLDVR